MFARHTHLFLSFLSLVVTSRTDMKGRRDNFTREDTTAAAVRVNHTEHSREKTIHSILRVIWDAVVKTVGIKRRGGVKYCQGTDVVPRKRWKLQKEISWCILFAGRER